MRIARVLDIDIYINKFLLIITFITIITGNGREFAAIFLILLVHEFSHVIAARILQIKVSQIELLPFGGAVKLESFFEVNPNNEIVVALAGPVSNILMLTGCFILLNYNLIEKGYMTNLFININTMLAGFNLLPALPLDGGRILRGILTKEVGMKRATTIASNGGFILALFLIMTGVYGFYYRTINYSMFILAAFLIYSAIKERKSFTYVLLKDITGKKESLLREGSMHVREIAVLYNIPLKNIVKKFSPQKYHYVQVLDEQLNGIGELSEGQIVNGLLDYGINIPVASLLRKRAK